MRSTDKRINKEQAFQNKIEIYILTRTNKRSIFKNCMLQYR